MTLLALDGVGVSLGGRSVIAGITFSVAAGEWAALIGPNGSGKTTTLRAIAGLVAHRGSVRLGGIEAGRLKRRERARRLAVVTQIPTTPADMTVSDFVLLGRTPHLGYFGIEGARDVAAADRALARLDLTELAARRLGSLSGGERQRAVLARALAQEADVVLLDEPTTALDLARQQQVLALVDSLRREHGIAVVAAMHDLASVSLYADRIHLLGGGRLVASGVPGDVLREDLLGETFGVAVRVLDRDGELIVVPARSRVPA